MTLPQFVYALSVIIALLGVFAFFLAYHLYQLRQRPSVTTAIGLKYPFPLLNVTLVGEALIGFWINPLPQGRYTRVCLALLYVGAVGVVIGFVLRFF